MKILTNITYKQHYIRDILCKKLVFKLIIEHNYSFKTLFLHLIDGLLEDNTSDICIN